MEKKNQLPDLTVVSFVTSMNEEQLSQIKGGVQETGSVTGTGSCGSIYWFTYNWSCETTTGSGCSSSDKEPTWCDMTP